MMPQAKTAENTFKLSFPLPRPHLGLPLANGRLGALVWGENNILRLTVNHADFWDRRFGESVQPGQTYRQLVDSFDPYDVAPTEACFVKKIHPDALKDIWWRPTRLPVGRFELMLVPGETLDAIELDYSSGTATVSTRSGKSISLAVSREKCQLLANDPSGLVETVTPKASWDLVSAVFQKARIPAPVPAPEGEGKACGWFQPLPKDPGLSCLCRKTNYGLAVSLELSPEPVWDFSPEDWRRVSAANPVWWESFWKQCPEIKVPDDFLGRFFRLALFKFACATDPSGSACGLQGPWVEEYQRTPWSGDYHFNVNVQQVYTLGFSIGAYAHFLPLFDMMESDGFQRTMRENARNLFGIDDGLLLTHAIADSGEQCGGISVGAVLDFACGGWMAQLYWLYYQHTQDLEFLKNRAFGFMKGTMRVFEAALEEREGKLSLPLATSPEYGCTFPVLKNGRLVRQSSGRNPSNQLMCAHMLADALIAASQALGIAPKASWLDIKARLPKYTVGGEPNSERIILWEGQDLDVCHRHHSHLAGVYPFGTLDCPDEQEARCLDNTIDHWILKGMGQWSEWCYPWAAIIQARLGFKDAPALLLKIWREVFVNSSWATAYLPNFRGLSAHRRADMNKPRETNEIMQLDGTMAGATAILEMLVHRKGDTVHLFPGVPDSWTDVSFANIRLPGGLSVSAARKGGELQNVEIRADYTGQINVSHNGKNKICNLQAK